MTWARRLKRVFNIDIESCEHSAIAPALLYLLHPCSRVGVPRINPMHGGEYLAHCTDQIRNFLGAAPQQVAFIPCALALVPFQINPHYLDPDPSSTHMGETREERLLQFHEENDTPVLAIREGCVLEVSEKSMQLLGTTAARLFRQCQPPTEYSPPCDLSFLLDSDS